MPAFKPLKPLKRSKSLQFPSRQLPPSPLASFCCSSIAACPLPAHSALALLLGHSSLSSLSVPPSVPFACHQPLLVPGHSACRLPGLHNASRQLKTHQALSPQRSSIAACPLPAHSPLLLGHSSLPFARLQTLKTLKTLQFPRGSFHQALWPSACCCICLHIALSCWGIQACRLPGFKPLKQP